MALNASDREYWRERAEHALRGIAFLMHCRRVARLFGADMTASMFSLRVQHDREGLELLADEIAADYEEE